MTKAQVWIFLRQSGAGTAVAEGQRAEEGQLGSELELCGFGKLRACCTVGGQTTSLFPWATKVRVSGRPEK